MKLGHNCDCEKCGVVLFDHNRVFSALEDEATSDYKRHFDNLEFIYLMDVLRDFLKFQCLFCS